MKSGIDIVIGHCKGSCQDMYLCQTLLLLLRTFVRSFVAVDTVVVTFIMHTLQVNDALPPRSSLLLTGDLSNMTKTI